MIKRICLIMMFLVLWGLGYAQNQFVYVRYNPSEGNVSAIVNTIDDMVRSAMGEVVVFLSQASTPVIATDSHGWSEIRTELLGMQTAYDYFAEDEALVLNRYYAELFSETVDDSLRLRGADDQSWECTFIISEQMYYSDEFESLAENISVNGLTSRMSVDILTYNDSQRLSSVDMELKSMFKYNLE